MNARDLRRKRLHALRGSSNPNATCFKHYHALDAEVCEVCLEKLPPLQRGELLWSDPQTPHKVLRIPTPELHPRYHASTPAEPIAFDVRVPASFAPGTLKLEKPVDHGDGRFTIPFTYTVGLRAIRFVFPAVAAGSPPPEPTSPRFVYESRAGDQSVRLEATTHEELMKLIETASAPQG